jgi:hypothetical protein
MESVHVGLGEDVLDQLHDFVSSVASLYRDIPFHCFEHASHTVLSVTKLLASIEATAASFDGKSDLPFDARVERKTCEIILHPLTQFTLVFVALIHDIEYDVPNFQLIKEGSKLASKYKNKSMAEQNSIHCAWTLLMRPSYMDLRRAMFSSQEEFEFFRHLLVKCVMTTDIWDMDQANKRKETWEDMLSGAVRAQRRIASEDDLACQKAVVVIEHLVQASDVSHTMKHLNVFSKWNGLLFKEMFIAYKTGRAQSDPSKMWYEGELTFFDNHIIPLAKRLCDCRVFRASADMCLNNALSNRHHWEQNGKSIVQDYLQIHELKSAVARVIPERVMRVPSLVVGENPLDDRTD